jgi:hypothetical protein
MATRQQAPQIDPNRQFPYYYYYYYYDQECQRPLYPERVVHYHTPGTSSLLASCGEVMSEDIDNHVVGPPPPLSWVEASHSAVLRSCVHSLVMMTHLLLCILQLRKFEIVQKIGRGAYGIVWKAVDKRTRSVLAPFQPPAPGRQWQRDGGAVSQHLSLRCRLSPACMEAPTTPCSRPPPRRPAATIFRPALRRQQ